LSSAEGRYLKISFDEVFEKLREYAKLKARCHEVRAIVLTGSLAKGTYTGTSDADILVIADEVPVRMLERYELFADPTLPVDIEPRVYTTEEFVSKLVQGERFAVESLELGIPLFGERFFEDLKQSHELSRHQELVKKWAASR
jgi:predicted nucleotidyltransferase